MCPPGPSPRWRKGGLLLRKYSEIFRTLCVVADLVLVAAAFAVAFALRFHSGLLPSPIAPPKVADYVPLGLAALPIFHVLLRSRGLYEPKRRASRLQEARYLLEVSALGTLALAATTFFWGDADISRLTLGIFGPLASLALVAFRMALRGTLRFVRRRGYNQRNVLIVGTGALAQEVYSRIVAHPETGFHVIGTLGPERRWRALPDVIGPYERLHEVVTRHQIDQVILALDRSDPVDPIKLVEELGDTTAAVRIAPDLLGLHTVNAATEDFDGLPMICLVETRQIGWNAVFKRSLDVVVSALGLAVLSPLLAAIALAVRITSPGGPVLYRQRRVSLDGREFTMLKFRTMIPDAEAETGPRWAEQNDPRRTPIGGVLRRFNLDELPQLWNVLRGEMSLVGPRPERPELIEEFRRQIPGYMLRHKVKGGLTGLAQVNGFRGNTSIRGRLELDLEYAQRCSIWLDLRILVSTLIWSFRDPNAY